MKSSTTKWRSETATKVFWEEKKFMTQTYVLVIRSSSNEMLMSLILLLSGKLWWKRRLWLLVALMASLCQALSPGLSSQGYRERLSSQGYRERQDLLFEKWVGVILWYYHRYFPSLTRRTRRWTPPGRRSLPVRLWKQWRDIESWDRRAFSCGGPDSHLLQLQQPESDLQSSQPQQELATLTTNPLEVQPTPSPSSGSNRLTPFLDQIGLLEDSVLNGRFLQLLAIRSHIPEIVCKVTDNSHWIDVKFNQQILKVMTSSIDEENYLVIVSVKLLECIITTVNRL